VSVAEWPSPPCHPPLAAPSASVGGSARTFSLSMVLKSGSTLAAGDPPRVGSHRRIIVGAYHSLSARVQEKNALLAGTAQGTGASQSGKNVENRLARTALTSQK